jgi:hypothetical protein
MARFNFLYLKNTLEERPATMPQAYKVKLKFIQIYMVDDQNNIMYF